MQTIINYSSKLLKIELQQVNKQLNIFSKDIIEKANMAIDKALNLQKNGENYYIYFPTEIEKKIPRQLLRQISKEITANEVRVLTAIVILAQFAKAKGEYKYLREIDKAYFEIVLSDVYKVMGLEKLDKGKKRMLVKDALFALNQKKYFVGNSGNDIKITQLVEVHKINKNNPDKLKIIVEGSFFDFNPSMKNSYFNIPVDLNKLLRSVSRGRPNAGIELFIKCLYQAKHCSTTGSVEYSYDKLFDIMKLEKLVKNRHKDRIPRTIQNAFETAKKIGLVEEVKEEKSRFGGVKYVIEFCD
ncbi:hypothetical protein [Flexithrix dorotheae]|uniref:hypothetical protein n=1 Tax=Flexithrix dorotheae TaxID=70993 RepID=UPI00037506E7|nr:hypothetical protein [Flexithrix dorotheae]